MKEFNDIYNVISDIIYTNSIMFLNALIRIIVKITMKYHAIASLTQARVQNRNFIKMKSRYATGLY